MTEGTMAVEATALTKRYPGVLALDDVSVAIAAGEVRAILGKNGAGKSTLIRALTGAEVPDAGTVRIGGAVLDAPAVSRTRQAAALGVRVVYQELSLIPEMTVAENMFLGDWPKARGIVDLKAMRERAAAVLDTLGFDIDPRERVVRLGPARRQLVEIARALTDTPRLLILDEPSSSLAAAEVDLLFAAVRRMAERGVAVLYVSHRMKEIRAIADTATVVRDGREIATFKVSERETGEVVEMMLGNTHPETVRDEIPTPSTAAKTVLSVKDLAVAGKFDAVDLDIRAGEVLGIAGLLGSGRTEILRAIAGLDPHATGSLTHHGAPLTGSYRDRIAKGIAITPENRKDDGIFPLLGVDENIVLADTGKVTRGGVFDRARVGRETAAIVARMSVKAARQSTPIGTLSGGNQQKVVIGRWIYTGADILLLDEPTRGVDVEAKAQIYALVRELAADGKAVVFVSSEVEELPLVCDRILVLKDGRIAQEFVGRGADADKVLAATIT